MACSTDTKPSPAGSELLDLELGVPTSASDRRALRRARATPACADFLPLDELSATRQFPQLRQRRSTSAGREPFVL